MVIMIMVMIGRQKRTLTSICSSWSLLTITGRTETSVKSAWATIRGILILQKFENLNFAWYQIMPISSLISELFLFLL